MGIVESSPCSSGNLLKVDTYPSLSHDIWPCGPSDVSSSLLATPLCHAMASCGLHGPPGLPRALFVDPSAVDWARRQTNTFRLVRYATARVWPYRPPSLHRYSLVGLLSYEMASCDPHGPPRLLKPLAADLPAVD